MSNESSVTALLDVCKPMVQAYRDEIDNEGYNLFKVLGVTRKEVIMCRFLTHLLDPNGKHGAGSVYLSRFLKILGMSVPDEMLKKAYVDNEYVITDDRRIDIVIQFGSTFIPIEVKIDAGDQESQCYDYYTFASGIDPNAFVVYLTKDGKKPSDYSLCSGTNSVPTGKIKCLSFEKDIIGWLNEICAVSSEPMKNVIAQYISAIEEFTKDPKGELLMDIADKICESIDTFRTAIEIEKATEKAKIEQIKLLCKEFEEQMKPLLPNYDLEEETKSMWFHYTKTANIFYSDSDSFPGINYVIKRAALPDNLSLWLRIDVGDTVSAMFGLFDYSLPALKEGGKRKANNCGNQHDSISQKEWDLLKQYVELSDNRNNKGWIIKDIYLPNGDKKLSPNFKIMNDEAISLADKAEREKFVKNSLTAIETSLLSKLK